MRDQNRDRHIFIADIEQFRVKIIASITMYPFCRRLLYLCMLKRKHTILLKKTKKMYRK